GDRAPGWKVRGLRSAVPRGISPGLLEHRQAHRLAPRESGTLFRDAPGTGDRKASLRGALRASKPPGLGGHPGANPDPNGGLRLLVGPAFSARVGDSADHRASPP